MKGDTETIKRADKYIVSREIKFNFLSNTSKRATRQSGFRTLGT